MVVGTQEFQIRWNIVMTIAIYMVHLNNRPPIRGLLVKSTDLALVSTSLDEILFYEWLRLSVFP